MLQTKKTFVGFIKSLTDNFKKHTFNLLLASLISGAFVAVVLGIFFTIYYAIINRMSLDTILAIRFTFMAINYLLVLILAAVVQIITLKALFEPQLKISKMISDVKSFFWKFFGLSIIINLLFLLFSMPVYAGIFLFAFENYILSMIAILIGILLLILFTGYIMFSPFIMIEKNKKIYPAIQESMNMASADTWNIFAKLVLLIIAMFLLNFALSFLIALPVLGPIIELASIFMFFIIFVVYIFTIYQDAK